MIRETGSMLPTADLAFLDEVFKAPKALLNSLLTIFNERQFKNGTVIGHIPLKTAITASNEVPMDPSLMALFDRILFRVYVGFINDLDKKKRLFEYAPKSSQELPKIGLPQVPCINRRSRDWIPEPVHARRKQ